ncbi:hypothetical protein F0L68_39055 [Solihabitans fulvus]|uniref:Uncharacterized protein n=1 Tax=Solihabitans fulvus TaxID=1892852 RepID=A0A5B2WFN2_9PSEU|nr:ribonucleotide-diphosphate reductase subunit beta [Solihabitans fulvus]KAA2250145.1 hypothetical protein F0L68_39055 [Solihabitans fulvus]
MTTATATTADDLDAIGDIPATADERATRLPTPLDLYSRWERQPWSVADVRVARDLDTWRALRPFSRQELLNALAELEVGEVCVTQTLSSLVDHAPNPDYQLYLCTQLADEARHVRFFQSYLGEVVGIGDGSAEGQALAEATDYATVFEPELRRTTEAVRTGGGDLDQWFTALAHYHLVTEGILATTALRTTRQLAKRLGLAALDEGLANVTRDESRHVAFGLLAARAGVRDGHRELIADAYLSAVALAVEVLVGPQRKTAAPSLRPALLQRAAQIETQWELARDRMIRQLSLIDLRDLRDRAERVWADARSAALDSYQERWGVEHPVRRAEGITARAKAKLEAERD